MREIENYPMGYIGFTGFPRYFGSVPQTVLFGRFVEQRRGAPFRGLRHAERPANTGASVSGTPSDSLRGDGAVAAFLQQAPSALAASACPQGTATACQLSSVRSQENRQIATASIFLNLQMLASTGCDIFMPSHRNVLRSRIIEVQ